MRILIDSDVISAISSPERAEFKIIRRFLDGLPEVPQIHLSMLTILEVEFNIASFKNDKNRAIQRSNLEVFKDHFEIVQITFKTAETYGKLKQAFKEKTGISKVPLKKHNIDIALASTAIAYDFILVGQDRIYSEHLKTLDARLKHMSWFA